MMSLFILTAVFTGCGDQKKDGASGEKILRVGCNADFAPFEFQGEDSKEYTGFDMDLIRAIGKEMGYKVDIQNVNFDGLIPSMEAGNIDVIISGMTINDERKNKVLFSKPYYQSGLTIVVRVIMMQSKNLRIWMVKRSLSKLAQQVLPKQRRFRMQS